MGRSAIAVTGLRKAFGDKTVLGGIDLDVTAGTVFSLLGPDFATGSWPAGRPPHDDVARTAGEHLRR